MKWRKMTEDIKSKPSAKKQVIILVSIFLAAFLFGMWYWLRTSEPGSGQGTDAKYYDQLAVNLIEKGRFDYGEIDFPPLYPLYLAFVYTIAGTPSVIAASVGNIFLFAVVAGLASWVGKRICESDLGYLAGLFVIINPDLLFFANLPQSEMLFLVLIVLLAFSLHQYQRSNQWRLLILSGVLAGLAIHTRAAFYLYLPVLLLWLFLIIPGSIRLRAIRVIVFMAGIVVLVLPWSIVMSDVQGEAVPIANYAATALYESNNQLYYETFKEYLFGDSYAFLGRQYPQLTVDEKVNEVWSFITESPLRWIHLYVLKLYYHLQFFNMKDIPSTTIAIWSNGFWLMVWPLTIVYLIKSQSVWKHVFIWIIGANLFLHPIMNISTYHRFRVPVEPLFAILAACGICLLIPIIMSIFSSVRPSKS